MNFKFLLAIALLASITYSAEVSADCSGANCLECTSAACSKCSGGFKLNANKCHTDSATAANLIANCMITDGTNCLMCKEGFAGVHATAVHGPYSECIANLTGATTVKGQANCFRWWSKTNTAADTAADYACAFCKPGFVNGTVDPAAATTADTVCATAAAAANNDEFAVTKADTNAANAIVACNTGYVYNATKCVAETDAIKGCGVSNAAGDKCTSCNWFTASVGIQAKSDTTNVKCVAAGTSTSTTSSSLFSALCVFAFAFIGFN